jgi:hypothetical protein
MATTPYVKSIEWDGDELKWHAIVTDDLHTYHGRSFLLSFALAAAWWRYWCGDA